MMQNPFGRVEIYVEDMERAKRFYEAVFHLQLEDMTIPDSVEDTMQMFSFPSDMEGFGCSGALVKMDGVTPGAGGTLVYFSCEDCANEIARVGSAGGKVIQEKMGIGAYGFMGTAMDTEGNMIGFHSMN